jgi:hypothetical protein
MTIWDLRFIALTSIISPSWARYISLSAWILFRGSGHTSFLDNQRAIEIFEINAIIRLIWLETCTSVIWRTI